MLKDNCRTHLILALDLTEVGKAVEVASSVSEYVDAIKVGIPLLLVTSRSICKELKAQTGLPIIADVKIADVPHIARETAHICFSAGVDAITIHGFIGPSSIIECVNEAGPDRDVIVLTEITHEDAMLFMESVSEDIARLACGLGASGIQAPGNRPARIRIMRKIVGHETIIVACGMGCQGGKEGTALEAGADFEIYGRSIYEQANPKEAAKRIASILTRRGSDLT